MKQLSFQSMAVKLGCRKLAKYDRQLKVTTASSSFLPIRVYHHLESLRPQPFITTTAATRRQHLWLAVTEALVRMMGRTGLRSP